jgi:hypothetical protein
MIINNQTSSIKLTHDDLRREHKNKSISDIERHCFTHLTPEMFNKAAYIYYVDNHGIMKVLKSKYKLHNIQINL